MQKEWALTGITVFLALAVFLLARGGPPEAGDTRTITVSVVSSDRAGLSCVSDKVFGKFACAYRNADEDERPRELPEANRLAPYVATNGELIVLAGVFADKSVQIASARHAKAGGNARFLIRCQAEFLALVDKLPIRFNRSAKFAPSGPAWLAKAKDCKAL